MQAKGIPVDLWNRNPPSIFPMEPYLEKILAMPLGPVNLRQIKILLPQYFRVLWVVPPYGYARRDLHSVAAPEVLESRCQDRIIEGLGQPGPRTIDYTRPVTKTASKEAV